MKYILILLCICMAACAHKTYTQKVVDQAMKGLAYEAKYSLTPEKGKYLNEWWNFHRFLVDVKQFDVKYLPREEMTMQAAGVSFMNPVTKQGHIEVDEALSIQNRLETLAHEAAHLYKPHNLTREENEVFAELVSTEICRRLGFNNMSVAAEYLQGFKAALRIESIYRREILLTADTLTDYAR
jgi:hypothetical protein